MQAWFARARPGADPYRLFAVSNLASLLALVGYPPAVSLSQTAAPAAGTLSLTGYAPAVLRTETAAPPAVGG